MAEPSVILSTLQMAHTVVMLTLKFGVVKIL